jgi:hypothetical protein
MFLKTKHSTIQNPFTSHNRYLCLRAEIIFRLRAKGWGSVLNWVQLRVELCYLCPAPFSSLIEKGLKS